MYEAFYGFSGRPFQLNPDPSFFYGSRGHSSAYSYLKFGAYQGEGFIVVTGEIGAGKTTLVRALLQELDSKRLVSAQLVSTQLDENEVLRAVAAAFGLSIKAISKAELISTLEAFLTLLVGRRQRALLVVDEAQNLSQKALEELRLLSNFQLDETPLLQIFLVGQPELRDKLRTHTMEQLRQRVIASYHLGPLDESETAGYVEHRLKRVGWKGDPSFAPDTYRQIHQWGRGLPRKINLLCNRVLLGAYLEEKHAISTVDVAATIEELQRELGGLHTPLDARAGKTTATVIGKGRKAEVVPLDASRLPRPAGMHEAIPSNERGPRGMTGKAAVLLLPEVSTGPLICIVETRSGFIEMAALVRTIVARADLPGLMLVYTGAAFDYALTEQLIADLGLPAPHAHLEVGGGAAASRMADALKRFDAVLDEARATAVLTVGDGDAAFACALLAAKKGVPVVSIDAGLRSFDRAATGGTNRVVIDHIATLLYTTDTGAQRTLALEGIPEDRVLCSGSLTVDAVLAARPDAIPPGETLRSSGVEPRVLGEPPQYALASLRSSVNVDDRQALCSVLASLASVANRLPLLWPLHPDTRDQIERFGLGGVLAHPRIVRLPPQGYLEMVGLLAHAVLVVTDSNNVQDETSALGVPCLTMRARTERPMTIERGTNTLIGLDPHRMDELVLRILHDGGKRGRVSEQWDGNAAERIASHLAQWIVRERAACVKRA